MRRRPPRVTRTDALFPYTTRCRSVVWPALPTPPAARGAAMLRQRDDSQWWTPEQHRAQQLRQATALLHHAYRQLPFYRDRLAEAGFVTGKPVTAAVWARITVLTRGELQVAGPALLCAEDRKSNS